VSLRPIPPVRWQVTGNHWVSLPCIHSETGAVHALGLLNRAARSGVEFAGDPGFVEGKGPPLFSLTLPGAEAGGPLQWDRVLQWLPTWTRQVGPLTVRGIIFAPYGRDVDVPGFVYVATVENRGQSSASIDLAFGGTLGVRQHRVRSARAFDDAHRVTREGDTVILEGSSLPGPAALAVSTDDPVEVIIGIHGEFADAPTYQLLRRLTVAPNESGTAAFYVAAGPERDGAVATGIAMRRRGWRDLFQATSDALRSLEQTTGSADLDPVVNRNLLFAYFYAVGRALDDAHYYFVRSRAPWNGRGLTVRDWDALALALPAIQLADAPLARELLLRACELHGYAPGRGVNYLDGTLFEPGFSLEGVASYALATERYIRETGDDQIVEEPVIADTLYSSADDLAARRNKSTPLYATEVSPSGDLVSYPYTLHANAVAAMALDVFQRTLDAETAKGIEDPSAVRAAMLRQFAVDRDGKASLAAAIDLNGGVSSTDDPVASALWLPLYEAFDRSESIFRRTAKLVPSDRTSLVRQLARLVGPDASGILAWLRSAPLDNGLAAEQLDDSGAAVGNGGDATLAGLLAYTVWYAIHALGLRP
jgi:hypothetical protein